MIVRDFNKIVKEERDRVTSDAQWSSVRMLLADDGMGFSFHITTIYANTETPIWYQNHLESVYCISGEGEIETVDDGKVYPIKPGTLYLLDKHDQHLLRGFTEMKMACVFNPPLIGNEVHNKDGAYELSGEKVTD